ncbi:MAG TPA: hypothetical protein VKB93_28510 [Thermoanaerobaculia bacterium]|nr:hypothetical protein [Thermoanaerobaculia bacterium]
MNATFEEAERAKAKAIELLASNPAVNGIGIAVLECGYGVKVNLRYADTHAAIPEEIDGVRIIVDVIGGVSAG